MNSRSLAVEAEWGKSAATAHLENSSEASLEKPLHLNQIGH